MDFRFSLLLCILFLGFTLQKHTHASAFELSDTEKFKVVEYGFESVKTALQKPIEELSLMAIRRGKLKPIPFQIDEYDLVGNVYFEESEVPLVGNRGVVDGNDKLLFMLSDASTKRSGDEIVDGKILAELTINLDNGGQSFVYLIEGSRLRSDEFHVRYSNELHQVETDYYSIRVNPDNALNWDDVQYFAFSGPQDTPFDTLKIRMTGGLILPFPKIKLNNDSFVAKPYAERLGPVRATTQFKVTWNIFKIPIIDFQMQVHYYPQSLVYSSRLDIPRLQRMILYKPKLSISLDGNNLRGTKIETPLTPNRYAYADGQITEDELTMISEGVDLENNWINVDTHKSLHAMAFFEYIDDLDIPIQLHYMDSFTQKEKPERYDGQGPNIGYLVTDIPKKGFLGMRVNLFLAEKWEGEGAEIAKNLRKQPNIVALNYE